MAGITAVRGMGMVRDTAIRRVIIRGMGSMAAPAADMAVATTAAGTAADAAMAADTTVGVMAAVMAVMEGMAAVIADRAMAPC